MQIEFDRGVIKRFNYLIWLESLVNVGCHFGPADLAPHVWDELMALSIERDFVNRLVDKRRERKQHDEQELNKARSATGVTPPGGTVFSPSKPFR